MGIFGDFCRQAGGSNSGDGGMQFNTTQPDNPEIDTIFRVQDYVLDGMRDRMARRDDVIRSVGLGPFPHRVVCPIHASWLLASA